MGIAQSQKVDVSSAIQRGQIIIFTIKAIL
jgi:hypothetical protein